MRSRSTDFQGAAGELERRIAQAVIRVYPSGRYSEYRANLLDQHYEEGQLERLLGAIGSVPLAVAELDALDSDGDKSHTLYVGLAARPSWIDFNRRLEEQQRLRTLRATDEPLVYGTIRLSRVGPFWMSYWNRFRAKDRKAVPELIDEPTSWEWSSIVAQLRKILAGHQITELGAGILDARITSLERKSSVEPLTVRECLFSDA